MSIDSLDQSQAPRITWEQWLSEEAEVFFLFARQQTRSESDAKDVLQEVLSEAWKNSNGSIPDKPIVFSMIRHRAIDLGRTLTRRSKREYNYISNDDKWFAVDYSSTGIEETLATAISELSDNFREVLILKLWGEMTFPEISKLLGIPVATATSRYRYALENLRKNQSLTELKP